MRTRKYSAPELTFDFTVNSEQLRTMENAILAEGVTVALRCHAKSSAITNAPTLLIVHNFRQSQALMSNRGANVVVNSDW